MFDIVLCRFPFEETPETPPPRRSPCIVRRVRVHETGAAAFVQVTLGTTKIDGWRRLGKDFIISNLEVMNRVGLRCATRFDLRKTAELPWCPEWFPLPHRRLTPVIGRLDEECRKELGFLVLEMQRG